MAAALCTALNLCSSCSSAWQIEQAGTDREQNYTGSVLDSGPEHTVKGGGGKKEEKKKRMREKGKCQRLITSLIFLPGSNNEASEKV